LLPNLSLAVVIKMAKTRLASCGVIHLTQFFGDMVRLFRVISSNDKLTDNVFTPLNWRGPFGNSRETDLAKT